MSLTGDAIRLLASKGMSFEDIAQVADANAGKDDAAEKRRAYDRERKRKAKEALSGGIPVEREGGNSGGIPPGIPVDPHARGLDNLSRLEVIYTTPHLNADADALVISDPPKKAELDILAVALRASAGAAIDAASPRMIDLSPIVRLLRQGQGPPCDIEADVMPAVVARAASARPGSIRSWEYFTGAIIEARDRRLAGAPQQNQVHAPHHLSPSPDSRRAATDANMARALSAVDTLIDRGFGQAGG